MKLKPIECPSCGASIKEKFKDRDTIFCSYCGQQIYLDDEKQEYNINISKTTHTHYVDEAKVLHEINNKKEFKCAMIVLLITFAIPFVILLIIFLHEKLSVANGKISAGYYKDLLGEDYKTVKSHFKAAGFTNIELIDLDDSGLFFMNDGKVKSISVGGDTSFDSMNFYDPDTKVVISYH